MDLEKAFVRVPRKVVKWALGKMGVEECGFHFASRVWINSTAVFRLHACCLQRGEKWSSFELLYADDLVIAPTMA